MCKICIYTLIGLCLAGSAYGASMTIVDLPAIGTDAAIDIGPNKTYTHAFDFGTNAPTTINGVAFDQGPTSNVLEPFVGASSQGYGYTIDDTRGSVRVYSHGGDDPSSQADGDAGDIATPSWTQWDIELSSFGIHLGNVTTLTIGFERTGVTGGSSTVFIDDIRLRL